MKIIDAHIHFWQTEKFEMVAKMAGHQNTKEDYLEICRRNNIVFSVAMGNTDYEKPLFGGTTPRVIDLAAPFDLAHYNQPPSIGYCAGVKSDDLNAGNAVTTALEFERYLQTPQCLGIKIYAGYNHVYVYDPLHYPLMELAEQYGVPVVIHTGDTATPTALLKYAHPLTVDEIAVKFPRVKFVIAHTGNPWLLDAIEVAAKNENVYVELSGLAAGDIRFASFYKAQKAYFDYLRMWLDYLDRYDRVLYGSDWPLVNIDNYILVLQQVIEEKHHQAVFHDNALNVYSKIKNLL